MSTNPTPIWDNSDVGVPNEIQQNPDLKTVAPAPPAMAYQKTGETPIPLTQHMIGPGGTAMDIPVQNVAAALKDGGKLAVKGKGPSGTAMSVPMDKAEAAVKDGFQINAPLDMQPVNTVTGGAADGDFGSGIIKGVGETAHSVGRIANALTGDNVPSLPTSFTEPDYLQSQSGSETAGKVGENIAEFALGDEGLKSLNVADRLGIAQKLLKMSQDSPYIARLLEAGVNASRYGLLGGGQAKLHGVSNEDAVTRGLETGVTGGILDAGAGVADVAKTSGLPDTANQVLKGADITQPDAQQALRTAAGSAGQDESIANNVAVNPSLRTTLEEPIDTIMGQAKTAYRQIDQAAGTDFKMLNEKLDNTEYQIRQLTDTEEDVQKEASLEKSRQGLIDKIADAKQQAIDAGVDPKVLDQADAQFTQARALQDLETKVFKNPNIVSGNSNYGVPETVNVDSAIKALQRLQDFKKYGAPRLEQALGDEGANKLLNELYAAQSAGKKAVNAQQLLKTIGKWSGYVGGATAGGLSIAHELTK